MIWATTFENGRPIPLDATLGPDRKPLLTTYPEDGNVTAIPRTGSSLLRVTVGVAGTGPYKAHFATCPKAAQFRKKKSQARR
jgi:hypothetical protein